MRVAMGDFPREADGVSQFLGELKVVELLFRKRDELVRQMKEGLHLALALALGGSLQKFKIGIAREVGCVVGSASCHGNFSWFGFMGLPQIVA